MKLTHDCIMNVAFFCNTKTRYKLYKSCRSIHNRSEIGGEKYKQFFINNYLHDENEDDLDSIRREGSLLKYVNYFEKYILGNKEYRIEEKEIYHAGACEADKHILYYHENKLVFNVEMKYEFRFEFILTNYKYGYQYNIFNLRIFKEYFSRIIKKENEIKNKM